MSLVWTIVASPVTHVAWPATRLCFSVANHLVFLPILLAFRTALYATVYLPLLPILYLANVPYNSSVPVEQMLFSLARHLLPHLVDLVGHAVHGLMMSVYVGVLVGMVAGLNMSLVARFLTPVAAPEAETKCETTHAAPWAKKEKAETVSKQGHDWVESYQRLQAKKHPQTPPSESRTPASEAKNEDVLDLENKPRASGSSSSVLAPELAHAEIFEDDDGFNYVMAPARRSSSGSVPRTCGDIAEEPETDGTPPLPSRAASVSPLSAANSLPREAIGEALVETKGPKTALGTELGSLEHATPVETVVKQP